MQKMLYLHPILVPGNSGLEIRWLDCLLIGVWGKYRIFGLVLWARPTVHIGDRGAGAHKAS